MEKFIAGFEKRIDETEKTAMGAKIIKTLKGAVGKVSNYFSRGVPKAVRNAQTGGVKPYPGVEAHKMKVPQTAKAPLKVRSNPKPAKPLNYSQINSMPKPAARTIDYRSM